jgi:hypothetical protein
MKFTRTAPINDNGGDHPAPEEGQEKRPTHQAFTALRLYRERPLDLRRSDHRALVAWKEAVLGDLRNGDGEVNNFQLAMVDRSVELLIILSTMAAYVEENGIMGKDGELVACLKQSFLAYQNSFRLALAAAYEYGGKKRGKRPKVPSLEDYLRGKTSKEEKNEGQKSFGEEA